MEVTLTHFQILKMSYNFDTGGEKSMQGTPGQAGNLESVRVVLLPWPKAIKGLSLRNEGGRTSWKEGKRNRRLNFLFFWSTPGFSFFFSEFMYLIWNIFHCSPGLNTPSYCALLTLHLQEVMGGGLKSKTCHSLLWVRWEEMERGRISWDFLADHSPLADVNNIPSHSTLSLIFWA